MIVDRNMVLVATRKQGFWSEEDLKKTAALAKSHGTRAAWDLRYGGFVMVFGKLDGHHLFEQVFPESVRLNASALTQCPVASCKKCFGFTPQWKG